jgi:hypothetical protein
MEAAYEAVLDMRAFVHKASMLRLDESLRHAAAQLKIHNTLL